MIELNEAGLTITWDDGHSHVFHPVWLRERSFEESNKDAATGHRLQEVAFLSPDLAIIDVFEDGGVVHLRFSDEHSCEYGLEDLRREGNQLFPDDLVGERQLWDATLEERPWHDATTIVAEDSALLTMLDDLARLGFVLLQGMGHGENDLAQITQRIGPVRATNWGTIADVKSIANAYDLSMTTQALEPHVDNPYRLPGPGYIFLHCLKNDAEGGDSFIIDGFNVGERMRGTNPKAYETLATTPVRFHYADDDAILDHVGTLFEHSLDGALHRVRFHNRAEQVPALAPDALARYYSARRALAEEVWSDENTLRFHLASGDGYVVDNYRLMHGRTEIQLDTGDRHLRQCYMDRDMLSSKQKILRRQFEVHPN